MAKKVENWRIFIETTTNEQEEQRQIEAINHCLDGGTLIPDFDMTLVGYNEDWGNVIETSSIVQMSKTENGVHFKTYSGSIYDANPKEFLGIYCRTVRGELKIG